MTTSTPAVPCESRTWHVYAKRLVLQQGKAVRSQLCRKMSEPAAVASCAPASPLVEAAARRNADLAEASTLIMFQASDFSGTAFMDKAEHSGMQQRRCHMHAHRFAGVIATEPEAVSRRVGLHERSRIFLWRGGRLKGTHDRCAA